MQIFSYLDLKSLRLCMRVCKRFNSICTDGYFYRELNLKVSTSVKNYIFKEEKNYYSIFFSRIGVHFPIQCSFH